MPLPPEFAQASHSVERDVGSLGQNHVCPLTPTPVYFYHPCSRLFPESTPFRPMWIYLAFCPHFPLQKVTNKQANNLELLHVPYRVRNCFPFGFEWRVHSIQIAWCTKTILQIPNLLFLYARLGLTIMCTWSSQVSWKNYSLLNPPVTSTRTRRECH